MLSRLAVASLIATTAFAAAPVIQVVPGNSADLVQAHETRFHETWSGRDFTLKASTSLEGSNIQATWDFGDGTQPATFAVNHGWDVSTRHTYFAAVGSEFTAHLTVTDISTGDSAVADYPVAVNARSLDLDSKIAIDEVRSGHPYNSLNADVRYHAPASGRWPLSSARVTSPPATSAIRIPAS